MADPKTVFGVTAEDFDNEVIKQKALGFVAIGQPMYFPNSVNVGGAQQFIPGGSVVVTDSFAEVFMTGNATVTTLASGTPTKIAGTTAPGLSAGDFTTTITNRIVWTGADTRIKAYVKTSGTKSGGGLNDFVLYIAKNGSAVVKGRGLYTQSSAETTVAATCFLDMIAGDFIEGFIENIPNGNSYTSIELILIAETAPL